MQNTNEIRHHISSVQQTRKITNAMNLIASSRMKKAMKYIDYNTRYFRKVQETMKDILQYTEDISHPYLTDKHEDLDRRLYVVVAADKGMAGSYNSAVLNFAYDEISSHSNPSIVTVGILASEFFKRKGFTPQLEIFGVSQDPSLNNSRHIMRDITELYNDDKCDEVFIIYTAFNDKEKCVPTIRRLLPIKLSDYNNIRLRQTKHEILYHPSSVEVFRKLVPQYLICIIFGSLVQSYASEHFARMNAMDSATQNADELLKKLRMQFNMARQAAITREIAEITGAAEVLLNGENTYGK